MNNIEFDRKIKELVDSYQEPLGDGVWGEIERGLQRRRVIFLVKRVAAVAVAASLAVGLVLNIKGADTLMQNTLISSVTIKSPQVEIDAPVPHFKGRLHISEKVAYIAYAEQERESVETLAEAAVEVAAETVAEEVVALPDQVPVADDAPLQEVYDWTVFDDKEQSDSRGVLLDISSNVIAAKGSASVNKAPSYMPGSSMNVQQEIVPISKPSFAIPLSVGVNLQIPLSERFAIGTGLKYTYLQNSFQALVDNSEQAMVNQKLHYIGLPITLYYVVLEDNGFACYVTGGGLVEKGLLHSSRIRDIKEGESVRKGEIKGLQWSANIGIGLEYMFSDVFGIYFDPSLIYFFDCDQPFNIRTAQPLQFDMELGLRFRL